MSSEPAPQLPAPEERLATARRVLREASTSIAKLADLLDESFLRAVDRILVCRGMVVTTGMGKAGLIADKLSATFASTGTRSMFLHPAEAVHGDLGRIYHQDLVVALSRSGTTEEVVRLLEPLKRLGTPVVAITSEPGSPLGSHADVCLDIGPVVEACPHGLAPTTSTSVMLALGDALAITAMVLRRFTREDFARFHPAGALGRKLLTVAEVMRHGKQSPVVRVGSSLASALEQMTSTRAGCVSVVDAADRVVGFFTDGDLRRWMLGLHGKQVDLEQLSIDAVMTRDPRTIGPSHLASEAVHLMKRRQLDQILVVDDDGRLLGLLDVQDLIEVGLV